MDPVTHGVLGAIAGVSVWRSNRRYRATDKGTVSKHQAIGMGALAGLFPDIDIITYFFNPLYYDAYWHGTYTHSLVLAPLWAALLTTVFVWLGKLLYKQAYSRLPVFILSFAAIVTHITADLITAWEIGLLMPLLDTRVSLPLLFIIDPVFTLLATLSLIALVSDWRRRLILVCLCLPLAWVSIASGYKYQAQELAHRSLRDFVDTPDRAQMNVWPQPFALSHWKLVYSDEDGVWSADVRLSEGPRMRWPLGWLERSAAEYEASDKVVWRFHPRHPTRLSEQAWNRAEFIAVRDFMTYPVFLRQDHNGCIWFTDWLFVIPEQQPPFQYAACQSTEGIWQVKRGQVALPWVQ